MKQTMAVLLLVFVTVCSYAQAQDVPKPARNVPKDKQTSPRLYLTARAAYQKWTADPKQVKILDVRTPEEYVFVGHPEMAWNVPAIFQTYQWDASRRKLPVKPNPDFEAQAKELFKPSDALQVMCRSGGRNAKAVDRLAEAGFKQFYNIIDRMEGDTVDDTESVFHGKRMKNGWKNSGLPRTYDLDAEKMSLRNAPTETPSTKP